MQKHCIWPFGINISAQEVVERSSLHHHIDLIGPIYEAETNQLFLAAKTHQEKLGKNHPAQGVLSNKVTDFYQLNL